MNFINLWGLARDGNDQMLSLAIDRLGEQAFRRINQLDDDKLAPLHYAARYAHPNTVRTLLQRKAEVNIRGQNELTPLHCAARYRQSLKSALRRKERFNRPQSGITEVELSPNAERDDESEAETSSYEEETESVVKTLIENGAEINARDIYGLTPLHYAAMRGNDVAARDLMIYTDQINLEAEDKQLMTPLLIAATYGYVDICRRLIDNGADFMNSDEGSQTPLHRAAAEGHLEIANLFLESASENGKSGLQQMLREKDAEMQTPLHVAVENGHIEIVKALLEHGAEINVVRDTLSTPLHAAAVFGNKQLINLLIHYGASVEAVDINQQTALHKAAANNQSEGISTLLHHNANIEKRDKDSFSPLLLAASSGHPEAIEALLKYGANIDNVDKEDKTAVFWCAEEGHVDALQVLLNDSRCQDLIDVSDRYDNSPLHEAARLGYVKVLRALLDAGSQIDNKNEDAETALHIASEEGHTNVVKELISRYRLLINDENEDANTPLHLASIKGQKDVVHVLLETGADVEARNTSLWTPLDCASAHGHAEVCLLLLDYDAPVDPLDKKKNTPLQLAAKGGHDEVTKLLLERGASVSVCDASGRNALELAIATGKRTSALTIVRSDQWREALKNVRQDPKNVDRKLTPFRMLIRKFPDVAEAVLDRCATTNGLDSEEVDFGIKINFEFIDDTYIIYNHVLSEDFSEKLPSDNEHPYNDDGKLHPYAEAYTENKFTLMNNHPLSIMGKYRRSALLGHPVVVSLVRHKWSNYVRYVYYFNMIFYCIFLAALTGYVVQSVDWNYVDFLLKKNMTRSTTEQIDTVDQCIEIQNFLNLYKPAFLFISKWIIICLTALSLVREIFQFYQARLNYIGMENFLEWVCYIFAFLLVWDWRFPTDCFVREVWQWNVGTVAIFVAWINLILFIRRLPFLGIYVVMFTDVMRTFSKFFIVFFLFIIAFALSFYMVMRTQIPFDDVGNSLLKTSVMMIGEFEYDSIFNSGSETNIMYPTVSYIIFVLFVIIMSVIIMNLLVGLAVDDIKAVQDQAVLKRLAMQAQLVMEVEVVIPDVIRRLFAVSFKILTPNKYRTKMGKLIGTFHQRRNPYYTNMLGEIERDDKDIISRNITQMQSQMEELKAQNQRLNILLTTLIGFSKKSDKVDDADI